MKKEENTEIKEMQIMLLDMLKWFHGFCEENKITYYVLGGTMLGAIRHNGYIPWDDDIDLGIPREDYNRLLTNKARFFSKEDRYALESYLDGDWRFDYANAKLYDTSTTLIENRRTRLKRGIFLDIFPLDGAGDNKNEIDANYGSIKRNLELLAVRSSAVRKGRNWWKNLMVRIFSILPYRFYNNHKLISDINIRCGLKRFDECEYAGNLIGIYKNREIMPRSYFGKPTLYNFEDIKVYGPEQYDEYLTHLYGDWRQLPPIDKQVSHHDFIELNLHKSYKKD